MTTIRIPDEIRDEVIAARGRRESRTRTIARLHISASSYDDIARAYAAAKDNNSAALERMKRTSKTTLRWALARVGQNCSLPTDSVTGPLPIVNAHDKYAAERKLFPKAKDAMFARLHYLCELVDQAYYADDSETLWRLHFILDALRNEVAAYEEATKK